MTQQTQPDGWVALPGIGWPMTERRLDQSRVDGRRTCGRADRLARLPSPRQLTAALGGTARRSSLWPMGSRIVTGF